MSNLREALAGTGFASLEWSEELERAVDRVAASGKIKPLPLQVFKAKYMLEAQAYRDALEGLQAAYLKRYSREEPFIARKCCEQAFSEFLGPQCKACGGARELMIEGLKVLCPTCGGSGLKRYGDSERARRMELNEGLVNRHKGKLGWLAGELGQMDREVNQVLAIELERL